MPKEIVIPRDRKFCNSGIQIEYTPSRNRLYISGFYDSCVGIEGEGFSLVDFFKELEIPVKNIKKALKQLEEENQ